LPGWVKGGAGTYTWSNGTGIPGGIPGGAQDGLLYPQKDFFLVRRAGRGDWISFAKMAGKDEGLLTAAIKELVSRVAPAI